MAPNHKYILFSVSYFCLHLIECLIYNNSHRCFSSCRPYRFHWSRSAAKRSNDRRPDQRWLLERHTEQHSPRGEPRQVSRDCHVLHCRQYQQQSAGNASGNIAGPNKMWIFLLCNAQTHTWELFVTVFPSKGKRGQLVALNTWSALLPIHFYFTIIYWYPWWQWRIIGEEREATFAFP